MVWWGDMSPHSWMKIDHVQVAGMTLTTSHHLSNIIALHHPGCQDHYCEHTVCQGRFAGCQKVTFAQRWMTAKNYKYNQVQRLNWCQLRVAAERHLTTYWLPLATQERGIDVAKLDEWGQQMQEQVLGCKNSSKIKVGENSWNLCKKFLTWLTWSLT